MHVLCLNPVSALRHLCLMKRHSFDPLGGMCVHLHLYAFLISSHLKITSCIERYAKNGKEIVFLIQILYFVTGSKGNLCSSESVLLLWSYLNLHIPFLKDEGYSLAAQVKRCFILQISISFIPHFRNGI